MRKADAFIKIFKNEMQLGNSLKNACIATLSSMKDELELAPAEPASMSDTSLAQSLQQRGLFKQFDKNLLQAITQILNAVQASKSNAELLAALQRSISHSKLKKVIDYLANEVLSIYHNERPLTLPPQTGEGTYVVSNFEKIVTRKNINPDIFKYSQLSLRDPLEKHAEWMFKNIYSISYPGKPNTKEIARFMHGLEHAARIAVYVPIFANLYRRYGDREALDLTQEDIKLLQIAALLLDSARENDNVDKWDHESALFCYLYFTNVLKIGHSKAKQFAEAIANKDPALKGYFSLQEKNGEVFWEVTKQPAAKNIYQKIIHDVAVLDSISHRPHLDGKRMDFFNNIASKNQDAENDFAAIFLEARSVIEMQGDSYNRTKLAIKKRFEQKDGFNSVLRTFLEGDYKILPALYNNGQLLQEDKLHEPLLEIPRYDPARGLTEENLTAALYEGKVFARGISLPSAIASKNLKSGEEESFAHLELRKTLRRPGVPSQTMKENRMEKFGNPLRSVCLLGNGGAVYANAGFIILDPLIENIKMISVVDEGTGLGKKEIEFPELDQKTKEKQLANLI